MLFVLKGLGPHKVWKNGLIHFAFWSINGGLALMVLLSVLPVGILQAWASVQKGLWYARSAEFMHMPYMEHLKWLRVIGDTVFTVGAIALGVFVLGLKTGWSLKREPDAARKEEGGDAYLLRRAGM
jgi:nitric oxide reductase subunit B